MCAKCAAHRIINRIMSTTRRTFHHHRSDFWLAAWFVACRRVHHTFTSSAHQLKWRQKFHTYIISFVLTIRQQHCSRTSFSAVLSFACFVVSFPQRAHHFCFSSHKGVHLTLFANRKSTLPLNPPTKIQTLTFFLECVDANAEKETVSHDSLVWPAFCFRRNMFWLFCCALCWSRKMRQIMLLGSFLESPVI